MCDDDSDPSNAFVLGEDMTDVSSMPTNQESRLFSSDKLDRASPDLWPEQIPGVSEFAWNKNSAIGDISSPPPTFVQEMKKDDIDTIQGLGSLTGVQLLEKVRRIQNLAYQIGTDENYEATRGRLLNIFDGPQDGMSAVSTKK